MNYQRVRDSSEGVPLGEPVTSVPTCRERRPKPLDERAYVNKKSPRKKILNIFSLAAIYMLSRQGSNLDSSHPECDVLPITPRDNF